MTKVFTLKKLIIALCILGFLWLAGLFGFVTAIPKKVVDVATPTDAIVVLTGGRDRVDTGFQLLLEERARALFVSGVHPSVTRDVLIQHAVSSVPEASLQGVKDKVDVGYVALDTVGNALEVAEWAEKNDYRSLRLVTAAYHMPRSLLELRAAMPQVSIIAHPVFTENVRQQDWWRWQGTTSLLAREYTKYIFARIRLWFSSLGNP